MSEPVNRVSQSLKILKCDVDYRENLTVTSATIQEGIDEIERLQAAIAAQIRWFNAERDGLGTFHDRMDLCKYSEWAARKAMGEDVGEFEGVPRLIITVTDALAQHVKQGLIDNAHAIREATQ